MSWNAHFYLFLPTFCILRNQVTIPSSHVMARKYSHVMVCHMSDCVALVDQAHDESRDQRKLDRTYSGTRDLLPYITNSLGQV